MDSSEDKGSVETARHSIIEETMALALSCPLTPEIREGMKRMDDVMMRHPDPKSAIYGNALFHKMMLAGYAGMDKIEIGADGKRIEPTPEEAQVRQQEIVELTGILKEGTRIGAENEEFGRMAERFARETPKLFLAAQSETSRNPIPQLAEHDLSSTFRQGQIDGAGADRLRLYASIYEASEDPLRKEQGQQWRAVANNDIAKMSESRSPKTLDYATGKLCDRMLAFGGLQGEAAQVEGKKIGEIGLAVMESKPGTPLHGFGAVAALIGERIKNPEAENEVTRGAQGIIRRNEDAKWMLKELSELSCLAKDAAIINTPAHEVA